MAIAEIRVSDLSGDAPAFPITLDFGDAGEISIDVTKAEARLLRAQLKEWITARTRATTPTKKATAKRGTKAFPTGKGSPRRNGLTAREVREWARANGIEGVGVRGKLPESLWEQASVALGK